MRLRATVLLVASAFLLAACGSGKDDSGSPDSSGSSEPVTLHVLAAASLTESFDALAASFHKAHPNVTITPVYDSSGTLATQVIEGAPADVLATADEDSFAKVVTAGAAAKPTLFASNTAVLVVPADNPAHIASIADLAGAKFVICVATAPCGKVGTALLADNGVTAKPASLEANVKAVLTKVSSGEADAGIVYVTDAKAAGTSVKSIEIPHAAEERTFYPIGVVKQAANAKVAQQFVDYVEGKDGQKVLTAAGFAAAK